MNTHILTCNAGSSSLKCALYEAGGLSLALRFEADRIHEQCRCTLKDADGSVVEEKEPDEQGYEAAFSLLMEWCESRDVKSTITAVGHRVVHGGNELEGPVRITDEVRQKMEKLIPLAPMHQPHNLALMDLVSDQFPDLPQVACFDTDFHRTLPRVARQFALPRELTEQGMVRHGFHGLSYDYITRTLPDHLGTLEGQRVAIAHLGSGASLCVVKDGKSIATTMSLTPLDGLMMSTRCGDLDPGLVLHLLKDKGMTADEVEELLYEKSGLKGASGISEDMRDLNDSEAPKAREAVELFCHIAARQLGGLITVAGGVDALVFTGAMGSNGASVRASICKYLEWLGLRLDEAANDRNDERVCAKDSSIAVLALPTDEEGIIAQQTGRVLDTAQQEE